MFAFQIPQNGWEKLFISFIPTETGKATAKTSKANVRGGSCKWADPIYETTRLLLDSKTKQYDDKLYKVVVGMGTSRSSILGEATINLADYADASQPSVIALPLQGSDHGTILHVTVQLLTAKTGFREFEQQRDKGLQSGSNVNKETENSTKSSSSELQIPDDLVSKARTRIQLREETNIHGEYSDSQVTCDESSTTSDNYYADKHDSPVEKTGGSDQAKLDDDMANVYEENHRLRASLAVAESSISELKQELAALQIHANEMGTETQKVAQELTTEIASSQELFKEVNFLKSECSKLKNDLQNLKEIKLSSEFNERNSNKTEQDKEVNGILDIAKAEKENLVKKMDQMECYYESLVQELEENQKLISGEFQSLKSEMNDLSSVNNELQKRVTVSESALKRARLNYSIAVSQLQKDLDMLSFQVLSMFETNQTVIKEAFADTSQSSSKHLSDDLKKSLSIQENIYKKVEEELGEMCSTNLQLNVYSETLVETLYEASDYIRKMNEKLQELGKKLEISNQSRDVLFQENGYYLAKCNGLQLQNQMLESDLGNLSNENFLLMEKITECEALLMDYKVFKGKYEVVSIKKLELEKLLKVEVYDKQNLQKEIETRKSEIDDLKMKFKNSLYETVMKLEIPNSSFEKLQVQIDSVAKMFKSNLESGERHVQNSEVMLNYLSSLELELQKILSEDKSFHEQILGLNMMVEEFEKHKLTISELKKDNQDLMIYVENKHEELHRLKECLDVERGTKIKLEGAIASLTSELESKRLEEILEVMICEDLKLIFVRSQYETRIEELVKEIRLLSEQIGEIEKRNLDDKAILNSSIEKEARYVKENESLVSTLELIQIKFYDTEARLNTCLEKEARCTEENISLAKEVESFKLKLEASIAHIAEISNLNDVLETTLANVNDTHALEVGQLKGMLIKSKADIEQFEELQMKLDDTELRLNGCLQNEAFYIEENRNLATELESLRLELQAYAAKNAEILESQTEHTLETSQLKELLTKSKEEAACYIEENRNLLALTIGQLEEMLTNSKEEVTCHIKENKVLTMELESLRLELQTSVDKNAEILESQTEHALEASQLKEMLTKSKGEVANYIKENRNLVLETESLRLELQASVAENAKIAESNNDHTRQLKEMLTKSKDEATCYFEENRNLASEIKSLRLEFQATVAKNVEIAESNNRHALEVSQLKKMLAESNTELARYIEVNKNLAAEVESLKLNLENYTAHSRDTKMTEVNYKDAVMVDDMLISQEESKTLLLVLKGKLEEQNDELIMLQDKCNQLTNNLSEQKLKTEEFKNLSIYLKELKDNADVAHEKKEKEHPEGPSESLRMAFVKEQYQTKIQDLKQQLSVSKRHNEEMLFKLQDALDEIESRKKSEASQLRRIQDLEAEGESVISDKLDYDRLQAELECSVLSLECCKEEKEKLVSLLQESEDEKLKIADELSLIREKLVQKENGSVNGQEIQGLIERAYEDEENLVVNDSNQLTVVNDQFRTQHLISCMEQLDEELEKMKNDNSLLPLTTYEPSFQDLQQELAQLHKANEELGSLYPNFVEFPGNGNALERVLALEIELAEALRTKKKSSIQFQSSFLKQHSDEEAVFKSFRDINDLIKDMLEIKGKYVNVENELKEMHDRYSQLSLQFAEVEGERQKLMMTLKNVRSSRNLLRLNRSSMAALGDQTL
ncbi:hypothetical protein E3N88_43694 [Mikania micrantha]|uniref:C2 NT-type domain-containing protein n=1 Tax=Mikania micrantha TaxID=192012 RepID=A0A5N6LGF2_9ASTR|nr:hypothetical protein E3N88_43694 [Mikania micrantha]